MEALGSDTDHRFLGAIECQTFADFDNNQSTPYYPYLTQVSTLSPDLSSEPASLSPYSKNIRTTPGDVDGWNVFDDSVSNVGTADPGFLEYGQRPGLVLDGITSSELAHYNHKDLSNRRSEVYGLQGRPASCLINSNSQPYFPQSAWQTPTIYPASSIDPILEDKIILNDNTANWRQHMVSKIYSESSKDLDSQNEKREPTPPSFPYSAHTPKLRTADGTRNFSFRAYPAPPTNKANNARRTRTFSSKHNEVENHYRNRLNSYYSQLLDKIPAEVISATGLNAGEGKAVSKTETLTMAAHYIKQLEGEASVLWRTNKELLKDVKNLDEEYLRQGGVLLGGMIRPRQF